MRRVLLSILCVIPGLLSGQDLFGDVGPKTNVNLLVEPATAKAGDTIDGALHLKMPDGWHTYWRNPGENGMPTSIKWTLPKGITAGAIRWPVPEKVEWMEMFTYAYHHEALLIIPLTLSSNLAPGEYTLAGKVEWLECEETCILGEAEVSAKLLVGAETKPGTHAVLFQKWRKLLPRAIQVEGITAEWAGSGSAQGERLLKMKVPVKDAKVVVEFFPYLDPGKNFVVHAKAEVERRDGFVWLAHAVESKGKKWPAKISGVVLVGKQAHEVGLKVASAEKSDGGDLPPQKFGAQTKVSLVLDAEQAQAGGTMQAGVRFEIPEKWHIFWKNPGDLGEAPKVVWNLPKGVTAGELEWPRHELYESMGFRQNIYHGEVMLIAPLTLAKDLKAGELKLSAAVTWQECEVSCVQGAADVSAVLRVGEAVKPSVDAEAIAVWRAKVPSSGSEFAAVDWGRLWGMLLLAFAGGFILNLMPCVLPVIALKVMGFVKQREDEPAQVRRMGILYGLGVVFSFLVMAGALLTVRAGVGGETWGMQMQNQWFLLFLAVLMTLVALNLFGVFEISMGGAATAKAGKLAQREGNLGAFANGMLMVALATPCLAPMLGTAIGFALTQPAMVVLLLFAMVALGLALPYVVLSFKPDWLRFLPKPGMWMESFKKAMGFPMLAAAAWLAWLMAGKLDEAGGLRVGLLLVLVAMVAWIYGEFIQRGTARRGLAWLATLAVTAAAAACLFVFQDQLDWKPWSPQAVREARAAGHPVLVDFTADWCLTCKVNKRTSIEVDSVRKKVAATDTVVFKGDFTDKNPAMADFIKSHGRPGVPLVLVYSPRLESEPLVLPELLKPGIVLEALGKAAADKPIGQKVADELAWTPWSAEAVAKARGAGKPVLVDFTADWCKPCKVIEKTAIDVPKVRAKLAVMGAATLRADYTDKNPVITAELHRFDRGGPPLVLVYPPGNKAEPIVMPKKFTAAELLTALESAQ